MPVSPFPKVAAPFPFATVGGSPLPIWTKDNIIAICQSKDAAAAHFIARIRTDEAVTRTHNPWRGLSLHSPEVTAPTCDMLDERFHSGLKTTKLPLPVSADTEEPTSSENNKPVNELMSAPVFSIEKYRQRRQNLRKSYLAAL